jgi:CIC family chloride channel protein
MDPANSDLEPSRRGEILALALLAPVVGVAAGLFGAAFRLALAEADRFRNWTIHALEGNGLAGLFAVAAGCALAAAAAAWLVRHLSPYASGSGIPHVEAVLEGKLQPVPFRLIPVKFFGGVLAIGSGLALGREGPSVQMGASLADLVGVLFRRDWTDRRILIAAGAGAGLATAFNSPIAGAVFVLEELVRKFEPRTAMVALGTSATAILVARLVIGDMPDFQVRDLAYPSVAALPLHLLLGLLAGLLAVFYNRVLIATMDMAERFGRVPVELRAAAIGAALGAIGWFVPDLIGGGDPPTQRALAGTEALALLPGLFVLRLALGSVSYAAGTPGGLFAPMLVLGAQLGLSFGLVGEAAFPGMGLQPVGFALVGMAAFFTGVVRAPLTGIVLVTEMTGNVTMLLPILAACFAAMIAPALLGNAPIYESLRDRITR